MAARTPKGDEDGASRPVADLSYSDAGAELDGIIEEFETGVVDVDRLVDQLERATDIVLELVKSLRKGMHLEQVKDLNDKLQFLESEADNHMMTLYKELFSGKHDAVQVVVLKDLYELLEKVIDRCRDAGNVIAHISLKHS